MAGIDGVKKDEIKVISQKPVFKKEKIEEKKESAGSVFPTKKEDVVIEWKTPEFEKYEKSNNWFLAVIAIAAALILIFVFTGNFVAAITFVILAIVLFYFSQKNPPESYFALTKDGVIINKNLYPYKYLESFWIIYNPGETKTLYIKSKKMFVPLLALSIGDQNPTRIREILLEYLDENKEEEEPLSDKIARKLRF